MRETIAGAIFILIWITIMVLWGNSKNIQPDLSNERNEINEPCYQNGHPLWTDC